MQKYKKHIDIQVGKLFARVPINNTIFQQDLLRIPTLFPS